MNQTTQKQSQTRFEKQLARETLTAKVEEFANVGSWHANIVNGDVDWSDEMNRIFGYEPGSVAPSIKMFLDHVYPPDLAGVENSLSETDTNVELKQVDYRIIDKNGLLKYITSRHLIYLDTKGKVIKITGFVKDVTKIKNLELRLKDSQAYYKAGIENSVTAFFVSNNKGDILETNSAACTIFGYSNEELIKLNRRQILEDDDPEFIIALQRRNKTGSMKGEVAGVKKNGEPILLEFTSTQFLDANNEEKVISSMVDITFRKLQKENEVAISNLNKSLEKRAEELVISNQELERFAYVASHDLQEPLRMVTSFLQLLQKKYDSHLDETAQKYINYAVDGAERMKALILDLLDYSRITSDKNNHSTINLNEVIGKTLQVLKPLADESEASIIVSILPKINGNFSQLMRLFQNLISNALKYRSTLTPIIEIGYSETDDEWEFFVKDNGIGIDPKYFEKIFIIFKRLHSRTEYSGTGIGLAICKKIVDLHKGRICVESPLQTGSQFYFTISKCQMPARVLNQAAPASSKKTLDNRD